MNDIQVIVGPPVNNFDIDCGDDSTIEWQEMAYSHMLSEQRKVIITALNFQTESL